MTIQVHTYYKLSFINVHHDHLCSWFLSSHAFGGMNLYENNWAVLIVKLPFKAATSLSSLLIQHVIVLLYLKTSAQSAPGVSALCIFYLLMSEATVSWDQVTPAAQWETLFSLVSENERSKCWNLLSFACKLHVGKERGIRGYCILSPHFVQPREHIAEKVLFMSAFKYLGPVSVVHWF